jgi:hypothetical protein
MILFVRLADLGHSSDVSLLQEGVSPPVLDVREDERPRTQTQAPATAEAHAVAPASHSPPKQHYSQMKHNHIAHRGEDL